MPEVTPSSLRTEDLRVVRTRRLLTQALIELAAEGPPDLITVRDLTGRAQVGYATFFRHYGSIADLLRSTIDDLYADLSTLLPELAGAHPAQAGAVIFRHVRERAGLYRLLLRSDRSLGLIDKVFQIGVQGLLGTYEPRPDARVPLEIAAHHFVGSIVNLIEWWLDQGMPYEPERMGEIYFELILHPTELAAFRLRA